MKTVEREQLKGRKSTSVFNYWGTNEDTESNKGFTLSVIKQSTITMKVLQITLPSKWSKMPISP